MDGKPELGEHQNRKPKITYNAYGLDGAAVIVAVGQDGVAVGIESAP